MSDHIEPTRTYRDETRDDLLKPCPCGATPLIQWEVASTRERLTTMHVYCPDCLRRGPEALHIRDVRCIDWDDTATGVAAAWNREISHMDFARLLLSAPPATLDEARASR